MKRNHIILSGTVFFCFLISFDAVAQQRTTRPRRQQQQEQSTSIWDDKSESNPYFRSGPRKTGAQVRDENKAPEYKKSTFKRRVYTGPSKEEMDASAKTKAAENFQANLPVDNKEKYVVRFDAIDYNIPADTLKITGLTFLPKDEKTPKHVFYFKAATATLRGLNIGEYAGTPMTQSGEVVLRNVEVPSWNKKSIMVGQINFQQIKMQGNLLSFMKEMEGELESIELVRYRSEFIINRIELDNIIRSSIFSSNNALFQKVKLNKGFFDNFRKHTLDGITFETAMINGEEMPSAKAAVLAMSSTSARILDEDLLIGARIEAQKENPKKGSIEQLRENAEKNKVELDKLQKEKADRDSKTLSSWNRASK